ncbi:MAG TPA: PEGA domain-containing protein [Acidobacteriota bacterium]|nr:PEGA domain-containing protein [Acidobacteriota bacterium]
MNLDVGSQVRYDGAVRNPDREGALAHLDLDRGFALVARASLTGVDVIDPTIWVREKLALAMAGAGPEPPLRAALAAVRSLHGEIMKRPERDRSWIAVHLLLFHGEDGVAISAGDCPCYRYRNGVLAGLGKSQEPAPPGAPRGSLGSETQVRIEVVPLRPQPGDLYLLATRPLQEGELIVLARALEAARYPGALLRAAVEGRGDAGRLALRILAPGETAAGPDAESVPRDVEAEAAGARAAEAADALEFERNESVAPPEPGPPPALEPPSSPVPEERLESAYESSSADATAETTADPIAESAAGAADLLTYSDLDSADGASIEAPPSAEPVASFPPPPIPGAFVDRSDISFFESVEAPAEEPAAMDAAPVDDIAESPVETRPATPAGAATPLPVETEALEGARVLDGAGEPEARADREAREGTEARAKRDDGAEPAAPAPPPRRVLASIGDDRPWYEPFAIWGGGALAIIALALLVRAILPGILGSNASRAPESRTAPPVAGRATGGLDIVSEPPGALVKLDGETLPGRTPLAGIPVDPGVHHLELDWGAGGTWRDTIEVAAGGKLTLHPAIFGSIAFRASEEGRVLDVYVDGAYAGTTPLTLERVTVGRHLVRFGGPGLSMTAQEVDVLRDVHVELVGNAGAPPAPGSLTIQSAVLGDEGFRAGRGDPVWVDGVARGATPFSMNLPPGMHSVRVVRRDFPAQVSVIEVKPGGEHFVSAEFGARSGEPLRFTPPAALSRSQPTPLTVSLPEGLGDTPHALWLHAAAPGGTFQARAMTPLAEGTGQFAALVPEEVMKNTGNEVRVYFRASGPGGHEIYSEITTIPIRD